jgi:hypothetical protein
MYHVCIRWILSFKDLGQDGNACCIPPPVDPPINPLDSPREEGGGTPTLPRFCDKWLTDEVGVWVWASVASGLQVQPVQPVYNLLSTRSCIDAFTAGL